MHIVTPDHADDARRGLVSSESPDKRLPIGDDSDPRTCDGVSSTATSSSAPQALTARSTRVKLLEPLLVRDPFADLPAQNEDGSFNMRTPVLRFEPVWFNLPALRSGRNVVVRTELLAPSHSG